MAVKIFFFLIQKYYSKSALYVQHFVSQPAGEKTQKESLAEPFAIADAPHGDTSMQPANHCSGAGAPWPLG